MLLHHIYPAMMIWLLIGMFSIGIVIKIEKQKLSISYVILIGLLGLISLFLIVIYCVSACSSEEEENNDG